MKTVRRLKIPVTLLVVFWMIAIAFWQILDNSFYLLTSDTSVLHWDLGLGLTNYCRKKEASGEAFSPIPGGFLSAVLSWIHPV